MSMTDEALMRAVRAGNLSQAGELFERYHLPLFDYLSRMTGDAGAAEDLVQDVFIRVLKYRTTFRDDGSFATWIYRIARNARADYFRTRRITEPLDDEADHYPSSEEPPSAWLDRDRDLARLRRALLLLREDKRELIVLARYRAMTHEEIGALLDISPGTVKVRLFRAVQELKDIFHRLERRPWKSNTPATTVPTA